MDFTPLFFYLFLGGPVIGQYYHLLKNNPQKMWYGASKSFQRISTLGVLIALLSGFYTIYFTIAEMPQYSIFGYDYESRGKYYIYLALSLLMFSANFWYLSIYLKWSRWITVLSLLGTALGAVILMAAVYEGHTDDPDEKMQGMMTATFFLVLQTAVMDLIGWNGYFLRTK